MTLEIDFKLIERWKQQGTCICKICGCDNQNACCSSCYWVEENLCSNCIEIDLPKKQIEAQLKE